MLQAADRSGDARSRLNHPTHWTNDFDFQADLARRGVDITKIRVSPECVVAEHGPMGTTWNNSELMRQEADYCMKRKYDTSTMINPMTGAP